jgi:XTP/dITP diphosphohydrolase
VTDVVVATRSTHKLREIRELTAAVPNLRLVSLNDIGIPSAPPEESIECFDTFEMNALAKARYFAGLVSHPVMADDSGLCVEALGRAPGVRSKRFSNRADLAGEDLDRANNDHLLSALRGVEPSRRAAHYVCVVAIVTPDRHEDLFRGTVDGVILEAPAGSGGFGYDPVFFVPVVNATFAQVPQAQKNRLSHRARAVEAAVPRLRQIAAFPGDGPS